MRRNIKEGKKTRRYYREKKVKGQKLKRFLFLLAVVFIFLATVSAITSYAAVKYFLKDLPEFDLGQLEPAETSFIYDKDGNLVTPIMGVENRIIVSLDEISPYLIDAFISIEDERFEEHMGFDIRGILRALWHNLTRQDGTTQGGSTITQQLVKDAYLTPEKTIKRKIQEVYLSYKLERIFSKEEILELYLNRIFFDYNAYGVEAAARTYFGKSAKDLTLAEAAMLAGIPNLPGRYSPYRNFEEAKKRQKVVLYQMVKTGRITQAEADAAYREELTLAGIPKRKYPHPWFVDYVIMDELPDILSTLPGYQDLSPAEIQKKIYTGGLHVYTTLDQRIQQAVTEVVENPDNYKRLRDETQVALIVAEPATGQAAAMVGGRSYDSSGSDLFNRVTDQKYQVGSVLKPILAYGPAFDKGLATPATVLDDSPCFFPGTPPYYPENFDMRFMGLMSARRALALSRNVPAIRLFNQLGVETGKEYAAKMGIEFAEQDVGLALVVGGISGVTPWQIAQAYSVLANEGVRTDLTTITKIVDHEGNVIYEYQPKREVVMSEEAAWLTTSCLIDAVQSGTATYLRIGRPVAAKTGTSDKKRDAWMAAYTPDYVAVIRVGEDYTLESRNKTGIYESYYVIGQFMNPVLKAIHEDLPVKNFTRPGSLKQVAICKKSGLRAGEHCPEADITTDWFTVETIPTETCDRHIAVEVCRETGLLASEFCPSETQIFFKRPEYIATDERWNGAPGRIPEDAAEGVPPTETCSKHSPFYQHHDDELRLHARLLNKDGDILLSWRRIRGAEAYYISRRNKNDNMFELISMQHVSVSLSYLDEALPSGTYIYQVIAVNNEGEQIAVGVSDPVVVGDPEPNPPPGEDDEEGEPGENDDNEEENTPGGRPGTWPPGRR